MGIQWQLMSSRQPSPNAQFDEFLSRFPPGIVALVKRCRPKLRRAFPGSYQLVYNYSGSLVVAFGMSERGYEAIVSIAVSAREVRLYFDKSLPDPKGILKGSGTKVRSVTLKTASDLDQGDIRELIKAAIKHSGFTPPQTRTSRMIIKSGTKKSKPKRAAAARS